MKVARSASFELRSVQFQAEIVESPDSDGGDLNDVFVDGDDGCQLELRNTMSSDLLEALASVSAR